MASKNMETYNRLRESAEMDKDLTSDKSRNAMLEAYTDDFEIVEPPSLPYGGVHKGKPAWIKMQQEMRALFDQKVFFDEIMDIPEHDCILLVSRMEWTAKSTGKEVKFPALELLRFRDGKICKIEMFLDDTKMIMDTLEP